MTETVAETRSGGLSRVPLSMVSSLLLALALVALLITYQPNPDPATDIGSRIRCPVCQGVPISESPSPMARDMMLILREALEGGASRQEAIDQVLGAYPGSLLLEPEFSPATAALWIIPLAGALVGAAMFWTVRRSRTSHIVELERPELEQRIAQIENDLSDLAQQRAAGEIPPDQARHLEAAYQLELDEAETARRRLSSEVSSPPTTEPRRVVMAASVGVLVIAGVTALASAFLVERPDTASGVVDAAANPESFSNETLAAVIASNEDHPQIDGMRLALAERYFESGEYQSAFPYYLEITASEAAQPTQVATALSRLGWMAYDGNGEVDTALALFDQASQVTPDDPFPLYLTGVVTWCGRNDPESAAEIFRAVLASSVDDPTIRQQIEGELAAAEAGETCTQ